MRKQTYKYIDYRTRPRKYIERRMILESFQRLLSFDSVTNYRYIGFGSLYFVDFKLIYKYLGIEDMISIEYEHDLTCRQRFEFNKPYKFIKMNFNKSTQALRNIEFDKKSIVWLDYDSNLENSMFDDIEILIDKVKSGSIILITLNSSINGEKTSALYEDLKKLKLKFENEDCLYKLMKEENKESINYIIDSLEKIICGKYAKKRVLRLKRELKNIKKVNINLNINEKLNNLIYELEQVFTKVENDSSYFREKVNRKKKFLCKYSNNISPKYKESLKEYDLTPKNSPKTIKKIFDSKIKDQIEKINGGKKEDNKIEYKQLYNFTYQDNAPMMTFGGIIFNKNEQQQFENAKFKELDFIRNDDNNYNIDIQLLTLKERYLLDTSLSIDEQSITAQDNTPLFGLDIDSYYKISRYMPNFLDFDNY